MLTDPRVVDWNEPDRDGWVRKTDSLDGPGGWRSPAQFGGWPGAPAVSDRRVTTMGPWGIVTTGFCEQPGEIVYSDPASFDWRAFDAEQKRSLRPFLWLPNPRTR